jgi:polyhydroxyalkanoate synthase
MHAPTTQAFALSHPLPPFAALGAIALKNMDRSRQARGKLLDRAGYGPQETPFTILYSEPGLNLRRFDGEKPGGHDGGPAVLLVPAPIKRSYIWDLAPETSVVRRWMEQGYQVYQAEWTPLADGDDGAEVDDLGLDDYGDRLLSACQRAIEADSGRASLSIAGHSLGGILAAIYSCMHPDRVDATVLLESPLHFERKSCCFTPLIDATPHARPIADAFRQVPGVFLNLMSAIAEPQAFQWERILDRYLSLAHPQLLATHMRVERWTHDEFPLPGRLFTELVEQLYRNDEFMQGTLAIGTRRIGPQDLRAPLVSVIDPRSKVIPEAALRPFHEAATSERKCLLHYQGDIGVNLQHVGVLVGNSAHARIWPAIFRWLDENRVR